MPWCVSSCQNFWKLLKVLKTFKSSWTSRKAFSDIWALFWSCQRGYFWDANTPSAALYFFSSTWILLEKKGSCARLMWRWHFLPPQHLPNAIFGGLWPPNAVREFLPLLILRRTYWNQMHAQGLSYFNRAKTKNDKFRDDAEEFYQSLLNWSFF